MRLAISQITRPAGAATAAALPSTNSVLSRTERTITFPICGLRYGGSSRVKDDGIPFSSVPESSLETANVMKIPIMTKKVKISAAKTEFSIPPEVPIKNIVMIAISVGKPPPSKRKIFPLQETDHGIKTAFGPKGAKRPRRINPL